MQQIDVDGSRGLIEQFTPRKLIKALNNPKVKEVRVFRLEKGMTVEIGSKQYEVISLNSKGKEAILHLSKVHSKQRR